MNNSKKDERQPIDELANLREQLNELSRSNQELQIELQKSQKTEQEANRRIAELLTIADKVPGLISYLDTDERMEYVNKKDEIWFGIRRGDTIGLTAEEVIGTEGVKSVKEFTEPAWEGKEVQFELPMTREKHLPGWGLVSIIPDLDKDNIIQGFFCFLSDITEQKLAEIALRESEEQLLRHQNQLRLLASELSLTEERERRSIAADLHDHVGQTLVAAKIKLGAHNETLTTDKQSVVVNEIRELLDHAIQDTRSLHLELSPPVLYELGFVSAVEWLADRMLKQHGVTCEVFDDGKSKPLGDDIRVVLFQAVRELLFNVAKHAQVSNATVTINKVKSNIQVVVQDAGVGFDMNAAPTDIEDRHNFGLFSIHERISFLGGAVNVVTQQSQGTCVTITAPLKQDQK